jgi:hypothetical protein
VETKFVKEEEPLEILGEYYTITTMDGVIIGTPEKIYVFKNKVKHSEYSKIHNELVQQKFEAIRNMLGDKLLFQFHDSFLVRDMDDKIVGDNYGDLSVEDDNIKAVVLYERFFNYVKDYSEECEYTSELLVRDGEFIYPLRPSYYPLLNDNGKLYLIGPNWSNHNFITLHPPFGNLAF